MARELGVTGLLDVDLVMVNGQLVATVALLDVRSDRVMWSRSFEIPDADGSDASPLISAAVEEALGLPPVRHAAATGLPQPWPHPPPPPEPAGSRARA